MSKKELEQRLTGTLARLKKSNDLKSKEEGYTRELERLRILEELIREQIGNENTCNSAR